MKPPNIEVILTDENELHCFKLIFRVAGRESFSEACTIPERDEGPAGLEIYLHTTQAVDLFSKLAAKLSEYMNKASAQLLAIKTRTQ